MDPISVVGWVQLAPVVTSFTQNCRIIMSVPQKSHVRLAVYSLDGKCVRVLADGFIEALTQGFTWDGVVQNGEKAAAGVYMCKLVAGNKVITQKLVFSK